MSNCIPLLCLVWIWLLIHVIFWCNIDWSLQWRRNGRDSVSNHQPQHCLLSRVFRRRSKKTSKLRVTGLCVGNSPVTDEFPAQRASNTENASIWWRHHGLVTRPQCISFAPWFANGYRNLITDKWKINRQLVVRRKGYFREKLLIKCQSKLI